MMCMDEDVVCAGCPRKLPERGLRDEASPVGPTVREPGRERPQP